MIEDYMSRHHFLLELDPPRACLRDLDSLNGTYVNGVRYGGRARRHGWDSSSEPAGPLEVQLSHGDVIRVGDTVLRVQIEDPDRATEVSDGSVGRGTASTIPLVEAAAGGEDGEPAPVRCIDCGRAAPGDLSEQWLEHYLCDACREVADADPLRFARRMITRHAALRGEEPDSPLLAFEPERLLGRGRFGAVYLGRHRESGERVAIKVLLPQVLVEDQARGWFLREIESLGALQHENIVRLLAHGSAGSAFFFVMEYCDGGNLKALADRYPHGFPQQLAHALILDTLAGLAAAHEKNMVHRDIKPENILLRSRTPEPGASGYQAPYTAKIGDFGMAKSFQEAGLSGLTITGTFAGTFGFMPREQVIHFKYVTPASDVWSVAATYYELLTGALPRDHRPGDDPICMVLQSRVVPIRERNPAVPEALARVMDRALATEVEDRYPTAREFREAILQALGH
jgi:hypothetical protein